MTDESWDLSQSTYIVDSLLILAAYYFFFMQMPTWVSTKHCRISQITPNRLLHLTATFPKDASSPLRSL